MHQIAKEDKVSEADLLRDIIDFEYIIKDNKEFDQNLIENFKELSHILTEELIDIKRIHSYVCGRTILVNS